MKKMIKHGFLAALGTASLGLCAQEGVKWVAPEISATVMLGTGNDIKKMKNGTGYTVGVSYIIQISEHYAVRPHLEGVVFPGVEGSGLTNHRPNVVGGLDLCYEFGKWSVAGGVGMMAWNQANGATAEGFVDAYNAGGTPIATKIRGMKGTGRVGFEYAFTKELRLQAYYRVAEANQTFMPSWVTVGLGLRF